jgi:hypothetical protein
MKRRRYECREMNSLKVWDDISGKALAAIYSAMGD